MNEKRNMTDQEFEQFLKGKMNELSDSVNCFDKIAERAFHDEEAEFEDSEFVVTELENITGRRRYSPLWKGLAVGLAAVFTLVVLPKTSVYRKAMCNLGNPDSNIYGTLVNDILRNTAEESGISFSTYDMELEEYIKKDVLVTPLYSCPFEDIGREDIRVRVFVRNYDDILTNEIYAVEYSGDYSEANFIAAAATSARFSQEELKEHSCELSGDLQFSINADIPDENGINATFFQSAVFKDLNETFCVISLVKYGTTDNGESYRYNITNLKKSSEDSSLIPYELPQNSLKWKYSVYSNGESALPETNGSIFSLADTETPANTDTVVSNSYQPVLVKPYDTKDFKPESIYTSVPTLNLFPVNKKIDVPIDGNLRCLLALYLSPTDTMTIQESDDSDDSDYKLIITDSDDSVIKKYGKDDFIPNYSTANSFLSDSDDIITGSGQSDETSEITSEDTTEILKREIDKALGSEDNEKVIIQKTDSENNCPSHNTEKDHSER